MDATFKPTATGAHDGAKKSGHCKSFVEFRRPAAAIGSRASDHRRGKSRMPIRNVTL